MSARDRALDGTKQHVLTGKPGVVSTSVASAMTSLTADKGHSRAGLIDQRLVLHHGSGYGLQKLNRSKVLQAARGVVIVENIM